LAKRIMPEAGRRFPAGYVGASRRSVLLGGLGLLATSTIPCLAAPRARSPRPSRSAQPALDPFIGDIQERTFRFFWETTNPKNGLARDRFPSSSPASIAAVGFALTAYPIGAERGYITRRAAKNRVLSTLRFFYEAPQGPEPRGTAGHRGFFYHFLDMKTGLRAGGSELSTVDTALFLAGALFCQSYFDRDDADERQIRELAEKIYARVDWRWAQVRPPAIGHGWAPECGFLEFDWRGYNEAMIVYLLALGSPTHPVEESAWTEWTSTYDNSWRSDFGEPHLAFAPLFGHQYCQTWIDFRGLQDSYMSRRGIDYFENNRRAVYTQRAYAIANPHGWKDYGSNVWGVTACDGPADVEREFDGKLRLFRSYAGRGAVGPYEYDDGTIAPTAVLGSIAFAPEIVVPTIRELHSRYGKYIYSDYGFLDAFNLSFNFDVPLVHGRCISGFGWVANDYLGIDQGPIVAMIENERSGLVWRAMRKNPHLRRGLERAGFTGGWLSTET
jgi:hypothetical protein